MHSEPSETRISSITERNLSFRAWLAVRWIFDVRLALSLTHTHSHCASISFSPTCFVLYSSLILPPSALASPSPPHDKLSACRCWSLGLAIASSTTTTPLVLIRAFFPLACRHFHSRSWPNTIVIFPPTTKHNTRQALSNGTASASLTTSTLSSRPLTPSRSPPSSLAPSPRPSLARYFSVRALRNLARPFSASRLGSARGGKCRLMHLEQRRTNASDHRLHAGFLCM